MQENINHTRLIQKFKTLASLCSTAEHRFSLDMAYFFWYKTGLLEIFYFTEIKWRSICTVIQMVQPKTYKIETPEKFAINILLYLPCV